MTVRRWRRAFYVAVISLSVVLTIVAPGDDLVRRAKHAVPWAVPAIVASEITLTTGLVGMLSFAGLGGLRQIRHARKQAAATDWSALAAQLDASWAFWSFWVVSLVGGLGDGVTLVVAIVDVLPPRSWGILVVPFADVAFTVTVRLAIRRAIRSQRDSRIAGSRGRAIPSERTAHRH